MFESNCGQTLERTDRLYFLVWTSVLAIAIATFQLVVAGPTRPLLNLLDCHFKKRVIDHCVDVMFDSNVF